MAKKLLQGDFSNNIEQKQQAIELLAKIEEEVTKNEEFFKSKQIDQLDLEAIERNDSLLLDSIKAKLRVIESKTQQSNSYFTKNGKSEERSAEKQSDFPINKKKNLKKEILQKYKRAEEAYKKQKQL